MPYLDETILGSWLDEAWNGGRPDKNAPCMDTYLNDLAVESGPLCIDALRDASRALREIQEGLLCRGMDLVPWALILIKLSTTLEVWSPEHLQLPYDRLDRISLTLATRGDLVYGSRRGEVYYRFIGNAHDADDIRWLYQAYRESTSPDDLFSNTLIGFPTDSAHRTSAAEPKARILAERDAVAIPLERAALFRGEGA